MVSEEFQLGIKINQIQVDIICTKSQSRVLVPQSLPPLHQHYYPALVIVSLERVSNFPSTSKRRGPVRRIFLFVQIYNLEYAYTVTYTYSRLSNHSIGVNHVLFLYCTCTQKYACTVSSWCFCPNPPRRPKFAPRPRVFLVLVPTINSINKETGKRLILAHDCFKSSQSKCCIKVQ